jgi:inner membrane protein
LSALLGGLYAVLFAILRSEDNALLMGALLLFVALASIMTITRRVDWYRLGPAASVAGDS